MEWQRELKDPAEFLEGVKVDLFQDEVYVFTRKGMFECSRGAQHRSISPTKSTPSSGIM